MYVKIRQPEIVFLGEAMEISETDIDFTEPFEDASEETTKAAEIQGRQNVPVILQPWLKIFDHLFHNIRYIIIHVSADGVLDAVVVNKEADV